VIPTIQARIKSMGKACIVVGWLTKVNLK
jgi:hypothetical protein